MTTVNINYGKLQDSYLFADIAHRIREYSARNPDKRILRLGIGDVSQPLCPSVIEAMKAAVEDQGRAETFHGYMPECGDPALRAVIADYYRRRGTAVLDDEVFISSGASDELGDIVHLFDPALRVMLMEPAYPAYADVSVMDGRIIQYLHADEACGFTPAPPEGDRTALIYLCSPNNPTGAVYTRDLLRQWVDYANRTGSVILFDAAYEAFITEPSIPRSIFEIPGARTCAIEICSLSKTAGFTGTRCGYTVIPHDLIRDEFSLNQMWVRNRTTRTNGVSYILQKGAMAVFSPQGQKEIQQLLSVYRSNAKVFMAALDRAGISYTGGKNAPYIWIRCPDGRDSWQYFDDLLEQTQVVGTPGAGFGPCGKDRFRFSMFADPADVAEAGERIVKMK